MLRLGHIVYSNCFPPHAGILTGQEKFPFTIVEGVPTELNRLLSEGGVDVSPSSSIEYAVNSRRYMILPGFSISSRTKAMSITLESRLPIDALDGKVVALTTASATSVVLLRVILEAFHAAVPEFTLFDQAAEGPPEQADAVLTIGDLALERAGGSSYHYIYDLGAVWHEFTGLPFVFALWQVNYKKNIDKDLGLLYDILCRSRDYGLSHIDELSKAHSGRFGVSADLLSRYWRSLSYSFGEDEKKGLLAFYGYAVELGIIKAVPELRFWCAE